MADLVLSVDVSSLADARRKLDGFQKAMNNLSVNRLASGVNSLQNSIRQLVEAQAKGTIGSNAYQRGLLELKRAYEQLGYSSQQATAAVRAYAAQLQRQRAAQEAARAAEELARAQAQAAARTRELRLRFQEGYAAFDRARKQMRDLREALRQGIITQDQYREALRRVREEQQRAGAGAGDLARRMNRTGVITQQAGYQMGDFIVQVQSGTNWMVAFGQQATQVVGTLTLLGGKWILIGSVLGVAIPLLTAVGAAFMRTRSEGEAATETVISYDAAIKNLSESLAKLNDQLLAQQFGVETAAQAVQLQIVRDLKEEEARLEREIAATQEARRSGYQRDLRNLRDQRDATRESREELEKQIEIEAQKTAELKRHEGLIAVQNAYYAQMRAEQEATNNALAAQYQYYADTRRESDELSRSMGEAFLAAQNLDNLTLEDGVNAAAQAALLLAQRLGVSLAAARGIMALERGRQMDVENLQSQYGAYGAGRVAGENLLRTSGELFGGTGNVLSGMGYYDSERGGRSRASKEQEDYLLNLQKEAELKLQMIKVSEQEQRRLELVHELTTRNLPVEEERIQKLIATEAALRQAMEAEERREQLMNSIRGNLEAGFMAMIDGSKSVEDAFKSMIRAILVEIAQQAIVKPIASGITSFIAGSFASGGNMSPSKPYLVGEHGPELVIPGRSGTVMNADLTNKAMGGGQAVVINQTFQFSANGDDSVKRIIAAEAPKIAALTQKQIVDQRRRGGQMRSVFG